MSKKDEIDQKIEQKLEKKLGRPLKDNEKINAHTDTGLINEVLMEEILEIHTILDTKKDI